MRKISANYVFPIDSPPLKNGIIVIEDDGRIIEVIDTKGNLREMETLEYFNGILVPGFINCHCHLEMSHLKGKIQQEIGLSSFIKEVQRLRIAENHEEVMNSMFNADFEMKKNGIVAVGDILNTGQSIPVKEKSTLSYFNFIEVFGYDQETSDQIFKRALEIKNELIKRKKKYSIIPHAPYSVSPDLFEKIFREVGDGVKSIHMQESFFENEFLKNGKGELYQSFREMSPGYKDFVPSGKSSLAWLLSCIPNDVSWLFIHNLHTSREEIYDAMDKIANLTWVFCPRSNMYLYNQLPNIIEFIGAGAKIALGTDSLASNLQLDLVEEMKILQDHFPGISFLQMIKWATLNGAEALNMEKKYGSLSPGKCPGINLLQSMDMIEMKITGKTRVKVIV